MNSRIDENFNPCLKNTFSNKSEKRKFPNFKKPSSNIDENVKNRLKFNSNLIRIIKFETLSKKIIFEKSKIEFSNDKSLLDKLFQMKDALKIKKKTFI